MCWPDQSRGGNALKPVYFDKARQKGLAAGQLMFDSKDPEFVRRRNEIAAPLEAGLREQLAKVDDDQQRKRQWQLNLARKMARVSPASILNYLMTDIADTGEQTKTRFLDEVRIHYANMDRQVPSKSYQDLIWDGDSSWGFGGNLPGVETPKEPPRFTFSIPRTSQTVASSLVDAGLLLGYAILLFAAAATAFLRYDVR